MPGTTKARWPSQPMVDSSFLAVDGPSTRSLLMVVVQAMNLFSGREIR